MKYKIFLLFMLFLVPLASALSVSPVQIDVEVNYGIEKEISVNLTNNADYPLYNLEIESNIVSITSVDIAAQSTIQLILKINADDVGEFTEEIEFVMYKKVNCSLIPQTEPWPINITGSGSTPNTLSICKGEDVRFTNNYESWVKVRVYPDITDWSALSPISSGSSYIKNFDIIGNFPFEVFPLIEGGNIEVTDDEIFIHSTTDDTTLILNINSKLEATNISVESLVTDFTIDYDSTDSGILIIKTTGNKKSVNTQLSADWFTFDNNNFDLDIGESKAINFVISPYLASTSDTNKTHIKQLKIKADNVVEIIRDINIFIPYADITGGDITTHVWWKAKKDFCDSYPTSPYCATEPIIIYRDVPEYDCPDVLANLSAEDVQRILREALKSFDSSDTTFNYIKLIMENLNLTNSNIDRQLNQTGQDIADTKEEVKDTRTIFFVLGFGLVFILLFVSIGYYLYKYYKRKYKKGY